MLSKVSPMADRVIDWSVGWLLLRSIVSIVSIVVGASIVSSRAWMDLSVVVVVTSTVSCKILQVSNYFATLSVPRVLTTAMLLRGSEKDGVVCVGL
jgi:hypothetical protein